MHAPDIPRFGYKPEDFQKTPFVFEMTKLGCSGRPPRSFPHRHSYCHILWLTAGQGVHLVDFEKFELRPPSVFFIAPHQVHSWSAESAAEGYSIKFSVDFFQRLASRSQALGQLPFGRLGKTPVIYLDDHSQNKFAAPLDLLMDESSADRPWREEMLGAMLQSIFIGVLRMPNALHSASGCGRHARIAQQFTQLVETHFLSSCSVNDYATMIGVSAEALNASLKTTRGSTAKQLLVERMVLEAKRRLTFSDSPIADVGSALGFEDPAYFARMFKKGSGMTPAQFRSIHARKS